MVVDWQRVPRSTAASLLSDDFPFLIWSKYLWDVCATGARRLRPLPLRPVRSLLRFVFESGLFLFEEIPVRSLRRTTHSRRRLVPLPLRPRSTSARRSDD
jgi:hypothetical protein